MNRILIFAARLGRWMPVLAFAVAASGCAHSYLHSPTRQKQAEATTLAWSEVDNATLIGTERENLNKLLQAEQDTQVRVAAARRQYLAAVIVAPVAAGKDRAAQSVATRLYAKAQQELAALVGPLDAYDKATDLVKYRRVAIFRRLVEFFGLLTFAIVASVVLTVVWLPGIVAYLPAITSAIAVPLTATYLYSLYRSLW